MTHKQKRLIKKGVITPVVIGLLLTAVALPSVLNFSGLPFSSIPAKFSDFSSQEITEITEFDGDISNGVDIKSVGPIKESAIIGSVTIYDTSFPLIYHANNVNANGKMNINIDDTLPGEIGSTYMELYKNDASKLKLLSKGDSVTVGTFYSEYEYEVADTFIKKGMSEVKKCSVGASSAVVLYTDNSMGIGISDEYFVAVCTLKDAPDEI